MQKSNDIHHTALNAVHTIYFNKCRHTAWYSSENCSPRRTTRGSAKFYMGPARREKYMCAYLSRAPIPATTPARTVVVDSIEDTIGCAMRTEKCGKRCLVDEANGGLVARSKGTAAAQRYQSSEIFLCWFLGFVYAYIYARDTNKFDHFSFLFTTIFRGFKYWIAFFERVFLTSRIKG